jgi:pimeloyl-ACP methyl ester carboxylesterase
MTRALSLVVLTVLLLAGSSSASSARSFANRQAAFQAASCPFKVAYGLFDAAHVRCGYVTVPENRRVDNGRPVKLAVAVFKSPSAHPAPDPLVYLEGGPGSQLVGPMGPSVVASGMPHYVGNRDLILVDQRGAGLSRPSLACRPKETLQQCRARLVKSGIDLAGYNTVENAADIAALGPALGYKQVDLFGNSYGTTLALQVMRDFPRAIRAVVMDGITGPTFDVFNDYNGGTWRSLQAVFAGCAASSYCNRTYPHLQKTFIQLLARLQTHPAKVRIYVIALHRYVTGTFRAVDVWSGLGEVLANPRMVPYVPQMIAGVARGDYRAAVQYAEASQSQQYPDSAGMKESMNCSDGQSRSSPATIAAHYQNVPAAVRDAVIASQVAFLKSCNVWRVPSIAAVNHTYFRSAIPTMLLSGRYDTKTPLPLARALAPRLGHAYLVDVPTLSHLVVGFGACPDSIASAFLASPNRKPNTRCLAQMKMIWQ